MAGNPRIDDLRKRIEKDPGSRLFAQLAEELRKDGELEDAIRVARAGLSAHPNYPSARMTLGRALLDTGDWAAARTEFEMVLKGAADNILASRYLGECLENLGQREAAIAQYKSTLVMAPGEKHVVARLHELEGTTPAPVAPRTAGGPATGAFRPMPGLRPGTSTLPPGEKSARAAASPVVPPPRPPPVVASVPAPVIPSPAPDAAPPPIPLATVDGEMELETSRSAPTPSAAVPAPADESPMAPIPLVAADEEFELEAPYEASSTGWAASIRPLPVADQAPAPTPAAATPMAAPTPTAPPAARPEPAPERSGYLTPAPAPSGLISPTLGELYFNQGFTAKAIEVYRELNAREPGNERLGARLRELEKVQESLAENDPVPSGAPPSSAADADGDRRQAIERTIARLEGLLSAIRKG